MFVALRELRSARGRFALVTGVVLLLALLVSGLSGLTGGLAHQNVSAVRSLGDGPFAVAATGEDKPDLDRSVLDPRQLDAVLAANPGSVPVGLSRVSLTDGSGRPESVVVLGLGGPVGELTPPAPGAMLVSPGAARALGDATSYSAGDVRLTEAGSAPDLWHAHGPVVVTDLDTWRTVAPRGGAATVVAGAANTPVEGVRSVDADALLSAMPSYQAEQGSLQLMRGMLVAISALVAGAFFTVWGIQRRRDVAVLSALGASRRVIVTDALGQAALVLVVGVGAGVGLAALFGLVVPDAVPYVVTPATTLLPALVLVVLGLVGAAAALRPVLTVDPTTALGSAR